ncbi:MAG TPA: hypothetical protein VMW65_02515 [Chloroflexota bacterium]|nr:hypothetical protein [Chloroflexota bacterium]
MGETSNLNRRRALGLAVGSLAGAALLSACELAPNAQASASSIAVPLNITLISDAMTGKKDWPAYVPSNLTVPAHSTINVRIVQFDDGAAALPDNSPYAKVSGVSGGTATAQALTITDPNNPGPAKTYQELAVKDVAHTFTVAGLKLNVPLPVSSIVSFTFETGEPGTYSWQCMAPCGTTDTGWSGPMIRPGYMQGSIHVV